MAIFTYYITNTFNGEIEGTNDDSKAEELSQCEEYFVVDSRTGERLCANGERVSIEERA